MRVYVVVGESGEYTMFHSWNDSVHMTEEGAVSAIESKVCELYRDLSDPDKPEAAYDFMIDEDDLEVVFRHPARHGNSWEPPCNTYDMDVPSWHIEEMEVQP